MFTVISTPFLKKPAIFRPMIDNEKGFLEEGNMHYTKLLFERADFHGLFCHNFDLRERTAQGCFGILSIYRI